MAYIRYLSTRDRLILTRVHRDKWTYKKTAKEAGLCYQRVMQIVHRERRRKKIMTRMFISKMEKRGLEPSHLCYLEETKK